MKNKKGFTLIELLAVIVILSIILVIAVPQVIKVVAQSKADSFESAALMILKSIEGEYLSSQLTATPKVATATNVTWTACSGGSGTTDYTGTFKFSDGTCTYSLVVVSDIVEVRVRIVGSGKFSGMWVKAIPVSNVVSTTSAPANWALATQ